MRSSSSSGFTLIELSIVLVIVGLVVGGVLVGRDLVAAAVIRSQISQIQEYQQAAGGFRVKYGYLPGDIPGPDASRWGLIARGAFNGQGDGNGRIEGVDSNTQNQNYGVRMNVGETSVFWVDLSSARLIKGAFSTASMTVPNVISHTNADLLYPKAAIGQANFVYAWSGGPRSGYDGVGTGDGNNYFGLSAVRISTFTYFESVEGLSVAQAYGIDVKMDDGLPMGGHVRAFFAGWNGANTAHWVGASSTSATPGLSTTCYDNNNVAGDAQRYSVNQNGGRGVNCALSFRIH